jgi:hypothetical protein
MKTKEILDKIMYVIGWANLEVEAKHASSHEPKLNPSTT